MRSLTCSIFYLLFITTIVKCEDKTCLTKHCIAASHRIFEYMNESADPCQDFNQFACGGYLQNQVIPDDKSDWDVFDIISKEIEYQGRKLLEAPHDESKDFQSYKKAKLLYQSCVDEKGRDELGVEPLIQILKKVGGWPILEGEKWNENDFDLWNQTLKLYRLGYSSDYVASMFIYADAKNNSHRVIYFDQADLALSKEYWSKGLNDSVVLAYQKYMVDSAVLMGAKQENVMEDLQKVLEFEKALADISASKAERRNKTRLYNPTTLGELPLKAHFPPSWTDYLNQILDFGNDEKIVLDDSEKIIIYDPNFYSKLNEILNKTETRTLANYLGWRMVAGTMKHLDKKARNLRQRFRQALTGVSEEPPSWKTCLKRVGFNSYSKSNFIYAASSMYARYIFDTSAKKEVEAMATFLRKAFSIMLENVEWMDNETKNEARRKLENMKQFIAYPDEFLSQSHVDGIFEGLEMNSSDYIGNILAMSKHFTKYYALQLRDKVDPSDWREHRYVALVNAFYNPTLNNFEFPAGILQGTFFHPKVPKYLNYGGIGFILGHEITHGFDDQGRQRDADGVLVDWWKPTTNEKFKKRAQCFIDQYGNFSVDHLKMNVNGINTQGENIADNGGIKEAYLAYNMWAKENGKEPKLPGHSFSPKQLFWIASAQIWCAKYRDEQLRNRILTGYHAPNQFRINGPLSNNPEFAKDFGCSIGSPMNPEKKCEVW